MSATNRKPVDPVDEELEQLLQHPQVTKRLDDFEIRRMKGKLAGGATHDEARRVVGLPPLAGRHNHCVGLEILRSAPWLQLWFVADSAV